MKQGAQDEPNWPTHSACYCIQPGWVGWFGGCEVFRARVYNIYASDIKKTSLNRAIHDLTIIVWAERNVRVRVTI